MKDKFWTIFADSINRKGAEELIHWLYSTDFFEAPASTRFHGCEPGGLCAHSVHVWEEFLRLTRVYSEVEVSAETAAIITLLHDLCKIGCYKTELRNKKENGVWKSVPTYVFDEDFCFGGHGAKSVYLIQKFMPLTPEEAVAINCHMGFADRSASDYSIANAFEQYPLAWLLHVADESATYIREVKR